MNCGSSSSIPMKSEAVPVPRPPGGAVARKLRVWAPLLTVAVVAVAGAIFVHLVRQYTLTEVLRSLSAIRFGKLALACACALASYLMQTGFEALAVRYAGRKLPYRRIALASFVSLSIGHSAGFAAASAVRYRIYSAHGLNAIDVAKICFLAGLTFWLGNAAVLGLGIAYHPEAAASIDLLPVWLNRIVAIAIIVGLVAYVVWVWTEPRVVGRGPWTVVLPGGPLTLLQIGIGILDLFCCALAMYMLVPDEPNLGFITVAVIFVAATLLGFASHAPGGLGVFDAAMMVALWQFDKEDLLAGLLLFRLLYYIVPFTLSLLILGTREALLGRAARRLTRPAAIPMAAPELVREKTDMP